MRRAVALIGLAFLVSLFSSAASAQLATLVYVSAPIALNYIGMGRCTVVATERFGSSPTFVSISIIDSETGSPVPGVGGDFVLAQDASIDVDVVVPSATPKPFHCRAEQDTGSGSVRMVFREVNFNGELFGEKSDGLRQIDRDDQPLTRQTQLFPFVSSRNVQPLGVVCDVPGGGAGRLRLTLFASHAYIVKSIWFEARGIDALSDSVHVEQLTANSRTLAVRTGDVTTSAEPTLAFDVLGGGLPSSPGRPNLPREIAVSQQHGSSVMLDIVCDAGATGSIVIDQAHISGLSQFIIPSRTLEAPTP